MRYSSVVHVISFCRLESLSNGKPSQECRSRDQKPRVVGELGAILDTDESAQPLSPLSDDYWLGHDLCLHPDGYCWVGYPPFA